MKNVTILACTAAMILSACAGRDPNPVQVLQPGDRNLSCADLRTEITTNTQTIGSLRAESGDKAAKNAVAGVAGAFLLVPWFFIDAKGAAGEEARALQNRNQSLINIYNQKNCTPEIVVQKPDQT
ncbi:MAG: hypothetical protein AAFZ04_11240 [Pseudomonadota bacterium]